MNNTKSIRHLKLNNGFTLIELMIVVAIVGILAAVAIPAYQDYTIRSRVSEGIILGAGLKTSIADHFLSQGSFPATNAALGYTATGTEFAGKYVSSIVITGTATTGTMVVTYGSAAPVPTPVRGKQIQFIATQPTSGGSIIWTCGSVTGANALPIKYLPADCRS